MITKYGYDVVFAVVLIVVLGSLSSWLYIEWSPLKFGLIAVFLVLLVFTLNFFRDPERITPQGDNLVISPADGTVVVVKEAREDEYLKADAIQISIFMSPLNVHVNRFPISGKIAYFRHVPGEFLVAMDEKSSLRNERTHIGVENTGMRIFFKQIAGFIARRIVAPIAVGDTAVAGKRFGMIKFGSRVDVFVPKNADVKVKLGNLAVAGETVLAVVP